MASYQSPMPSLLSIAWINPVKHALCLACLTDLAACLDAPASYHFLIAHQKHFVVHIHAGADVVGDNSKDVAHLKPVWGIGDVQMTVFLVELEQFGIRVVQHVPVTRSGTGIQRIGR